jgi:hypothetical protein
MRVPVLAQRGNVVGVEADIAGAVHDDSLPDRHGRAGGDCLLDRRGLDRGRTRSARSEGKCGKHDASEPPDPHADLVDRTAACVSAFGAGSSDREPGPRLGRCYRWERRAWATTSRTRSWIPRSSVR